MTTLVDFHNDLAVKSWEDFRTTLREQEYLSDLLTGIDVIEAEKLLNDFGYFRITYPNIDYVTKRTGYVLGECNGKVIWLIFQMHA